MSLKDKIDALPSLRAVVDAHGLMAKKSLGQNFLLDRNITDKIIKMSLDVQGLKSFAGGEVFEVGPGPGGLTRSILASDPDKLMVVEMDERCISIMEDIKSKVGDVLEIIEGDALKVDFSVMGKAPRHVVSNLPYNISVPLLIEWLKKIENFDSLTLMFQKEVAERIMAPIKTKDYGRVSILAQLLAKVDKLFDVSPTSFVPAPKIWSTVLVFHPLRAEISAELIKKIEMLTNMAFSQRRKMVRQSLKPIAGIGQILSELGIAETVRAEELTPVQFLELAKRM